MARRPPASCRRWDRPSPRSTCCWQGERRSNGVDTEIFETRSRDGRYTISTDKERLDIDYIHAYLSEQSYWAKGRSRAAVEKTIVHSLCFGLYDGNRQVGFARVMTDYAVLAWLCDVFVDEPIAGTVSASGWWKHREPSGVVRYRALYAGDVDAHELYRRYGFDDLSGPDRLMARIRKT